MLVVVVKVPLAAVLATCTAILPTMVDAILPMTVDAEPEGRPAMAVQEIKLAMRHQKRTLVVPRLR